jgi:endoglucanase
MRRAPAVVLSVAAATSICGCPYLENPRPPAAGSGAAPARDSPANGPAASEPAASEPAASEPAASEPAAGPGRWPPGPPGKPRLARGINFGNALDAPNEGDWGVVLAAADFARVRDAGFDHVRLPVRFSGHASSEAPYAIEPAFLARVDWAIAHALAAGLAVVVDMHHYEELTKDPDAHAARFVGLWARIAEHYRGAPEGLCFELLNEPHDHLSADRWNDLLARALAVVRAAHPSRTVIVEGVDWASAKNLRDTLRVPDDPAIVATFHMYQPILFTHQGASWMPPEFQTTGVRFPGPPPAPIVPIAAARAPGREWARDWFARYDREPPATNPSGPSTIAEQLDMAAAFARARHVPVYMGEFGAIDRADMASRVAWTRAVRVEAERRGFGWAYWDDGAGFAVYDRSRGAWVPELLAALQR